MANESNKPREKRWLVVSVLALLLLLFLVPFFRQGGAKVDTSVEVETEAAVIGDIREVTSGPARVVSMEHWDQSAPYPGALAEWKIAEGDAVKTGDVLAVYDTDSLRSQIDDTLALVEELDGEIQRLGEQVDFAVNAPVEGVVRQVCVQRGDGTGETVLAVLSTDEYWKLSLHYEGELTPEAGMSVALFSQTRRYSGTVEQAEAGEITVLFPDDGTVSLGEEIDVVDRSGEKLGTAKAEINAPVEVTSDRAGIVTEVVCQAGDQVDGDSELLRCIDVSQQDTCQELVTRRREAVELLLALRAFLEQPQVMAEHDGIVSHLAETGGEDRSAGRTLCTITSQDTFHVTVTVPLRYADRVRQGQRVELDFGSSVCEGEVASDVDQSQRSGITCTVAVTMVDACGHQVQDEAEAVIVLAERTGVVLTSAKAVSVSEDGTETVNVAYGDGLIHSERIVTGLNNGTQVEVMQGLNEGEEVVVSSRIVETTFYSLFNHEWVVDQREGPAGDGLLTEAPAGEAADQ